MKNKEEERGDKSDKSRISLASGCQTPEMLSSKYCSEEFSAAKRRKRLVVAFLVQGCALSTSLIARGFPSSGEHVRDDRSNRKPSANFGRFVRIPGTNSESVPFELIILQYKV